MSVPEPVRSPSRISRSDPFASRCGPSSVDTWSAAAAAVAIRRIPRRKRCTRTNNRSSLVDCNRSLLKRIQGAGLTLGNRGKTPGKLCKAEPRCASCSDNNGTFPPFRREALGYAAPACPGFCPSYDSSGGPTLVLDRTPISGQSRPRKHQFNWDRQPCRSCSGNVLRSVLFCPFYGVTRSAASPTTSRQWNALGPSPAGSRCGQWSGCRNRRGYGGCAIPQTSADEFQQHVAVARERRRCRTRLRTWDEIAESGHERIGTA